MSGHSLLPRFGVVRCQVRYVDSDQAVIETRYTVRSHRPEQLVGHDVHVQIEVTSQDGFHEIEQTLLPAHERRGVIRTDLVHPDIWWPAGMGEQKLYDITASLTLDGQIIEERRATLGMTSVRHERDACDEPRSLLVNGRSFAIQHVVAVDEPDEQALLPVGGGSLVIVRGHYGPDLLYDAADRAGVLLVQCVPLDPDGEPAQKVEPAIKRLSCHPSLVGWYVGHLGPLAEQAEHTVRRLDPQHAVFYRLPAA